MIDHLQAFRKAAANYGLALPDEIILGTLHRFPGVGKANGNHAGWARLFPDGQGGAFGDWSFGLSETWQAKRDRSMSTAEKEAFRRQVVEAKALAEAERAKQHEEAAKRAAKIWKDAKPAPADHPYLIDKGVQAHGLRLYRGDLVIKGMPCDGSLIVPARNASGAIRTLEFIHPEKRHGDNKRFLPGGDKKGNYFAIGKPDGVLCICEGFATGTSIHESTGHGVAVAFDKDNLLPVAQALRGKFQDMRFKFCADNDIKDNGAPNVGIEKATAAALTVNGLLAIPELGGQKCDFNDLHQVKGLETVRACIEAAQPVVLAPASERTDQDIVQRLAVLSPIEYDRIRKSEAKALGVRPATLDAMVKATRKEEADASPFFEDVDPWQDPVDPAELFGDISTAVRQFVVCSKETATAVTLWSAMTWFIDEVQVAPLAVISSPEKRCGKSMLLALLGRLVMRPLVAQAIFPLRPCSGPLTHGGQRSLLMRPTPS